MQETWVRSLGQKDPLKKEMSTHSSILAWEIRWTEEPGGLPSMGTQRVGHAGSSLALGPQPSARPPEGLETKGQPLGRSATFM